MVTAIFALWAAVASSLSLFLLWKGKDKWEEESPAESNSDPARLMREWFFGGDS